MLPEIRKIKPDASSLAPTEDAADCILSGYTNKYNNSWEDDFHLNFGERQNRHMLSTCENIGSFCPDSIVAMIFVNVGISTKGCRKVTVNCSIEGGNCQDVDLPET